MKKIIDINSIPRDPVQNELDQAQAKLMLAIKRRQRRCYIIGFFIASIPIITSIWSFYQNKNDLAAQADLFQAVYHFEAGAFDKALEGDGIHKGFLAIIKAYPYTQTAHLTHLYAGFSYMHQKEYDKVIAFLKKFSCKDFILQARALSVIGDAYSEQKDYKEAAAYYMKAAHCNPNNVYTPGYLVKAAIAFETTTQYQEAYNCYNEIIEKYPTAKDDVTDLAIKEASRLSAFL